MRMFKSRGTRKLINYSMNELGIVSKSKNSSKVEGLSLFDLFWKIVCIFPIFTVIANEGIQNKLLFAVMLGLFAILVITQKLTKLFLVVVAIMLPIFVFSVFATKDTAWNINLYFYYPFTIVYTCYFVIKKKNIFSWAAKNEKYLMFIMMVWSIIVGISIFYPGSYYYKEGGTRYFGSFCGTIFRLGPSAIFIQSLSLLSASIFKKRFYFLFSILPIFCYFAGSSRIYLFIGLCLFLVSIYWACKTKTSFFLIIIPVGLIGLIVFLNSNLMNKIAYTLNESNYGDIWYRLSSSRSVFWAEDIHAWINQPNINKIFGSGLNFTHDLTDLWAHNDFLEILCSCGITGLLLYLFVLFLMFKRCLWRKNVPVVATILIISVWFFNAFFNMHYVYFCCLLGFPFAVLSLEIKYHKTDGKLNAQSVV